MDLPEYGDWVYYDLTDDWDASDAITGSSVSTWEDLLDTGAGSFSTNTALYFPFLVTTTSPATAPEKDLLNV